MPEVIDAYPGVLSPELEGPIIVTNDDVPDLTPIDKLMKLAGEVGDFSGAMELEGLAKLGQKVVEDYERDLKDRKDWAEIAEDALNLAAQEIEGKEVKSYPWKDCSNIRFPLLTTAALQFNARSYPAVVKGDEAVLCKVVGQDNGRPQLGPDGQPMAQLPDGRVVPAAMAMQLPPEAQQALQPMWQIPPGAKTKRAERVSEYMNTVLFYRMEDWEADTDTLLIQLPVVGCVFRKVWYDPDSRQQKMAMVPALRIVVPQGARSCDTTPRLTEEIPDVYPHEINERMRSGYYRDILLTEEADEDNARLLLEQHRMIDLDDDGLEEPYIVTVDKATARVLRIEANFGPDSVTLGSDGRVLKIRRGKFYVKYDFFPHPKGKFYGLGLGHLLSQLGDVIDTAINQLMDAGSAQTAGGGFIASGVRLQARGGGSTVRFEPGEYKTVDVPGSVLRDAIVERTLPQVSPVTFQVLDLIMGAARDIAGVKDVITGEASNNGQVGTTLALIEQGLQVYNAVYKRVFRAGKEEFTLLFENLGKHGGEEAARDYIEVLDDPAANFEEDFNAKDFDIRPVSDPSSVTRMQKMARGQFLLGTIEAAVAAGGNGQEIMRRVYEAADVDDIDKIFPPPQPQQPDPMAIARAEKDMSAAELNKAKAAQIGSEIPANEAKTAAEVEATKLETMKGAIGLGAEIGAAA
jgi:chaperonin GroES